MARIRPKDNFPKPTPPLLERTEEEKVAQAPLSVVLGGKVYEIKPLVIRDSRAWRKKLSEEIESFAGFVGVDTSDPDRFRAMVNANLVSRPDAAIDLFFGYARDLPRDEIESIATDQEIGTAFAEVLKIALPLAGGITPSMGIASPLAKPSS